MIGFTLRPYLQTVRRNSGAFFDSIIASYQRADHLPVAPERLYYELSMHWVFWYIGVPAVALGTLGAALLARRCLRGQAPTWTLPLMIFAWAIVTTLYDPAITPDQPVGEPPARAHRSARLHPAGGLGGGLAARPGPADGRPPGAQP